MRIDLTISLSISCTSDENPKDLLDIPNKHIMEMGKELAEKDRLFEDIEVHAVRRNNRG